MLFRRRYPALFRERIRELVWPRKGPLRPLRYFRLRVMRLAASPHAIAIGVAAGVASSWTPFIGFHFIIAVVLAYLLAGDLLAAALGTAFGNPLTLPFLWATSWELGNFLLGRDGGAGHRKIDLVALFEKLDVWQLWTPVLKPMLVGALPLGAISGLAVYALTRFAVRGFQSRRRQKLTGRAAERRLTAGIPALDRKATP